MKIIRPLVLFLILLVTLSWVVIIPGKCMPFECDVYVKSGTDKDLEGAKVYVRKGGQTAYAYQGETSWDWTKLTNLLHVEHVEIGDVIKAEKSEPGEDYGATEIIVSATGNQILRLSGFDCDLYVKDSDGHSLGDAKVYVNGMYRGSTYFDVLKTTNLLHIEGVKVGDKILASATNFNSKTVDISNTGDQTVTLSAFTGTEPYKFSLVVSMDWTPDKGYLSKFVSGLRKASNFLMDLTDGQMCFGKVDIFLGRRNWVEADIRVSEGEAVSWNDKLWPCATVGGIGVSRQVRQLVDPVYSAHINVPEKWSGRTPDDTVYAEMICHEFGHYGLYLYDEYIGFDSNNGIYDDSLRYYAMVDQTLDYIVDPATGLIIRWFIGPLYKGECDCAMMNEHVTSEFCRPDNHDDDHDTAQDHNNRKSCWETIKDHYGWVQIPTTENIGPNEDLDNPSNDVGASMDVYIDTAFDLTVSSQKNVYALGAKARVSVSVENLGSSSCTYFLEVSFKHLSENKEYDCTELRDEDGNDASSSEETLESWQSCMYYAEWDIPSDATLGVCQVRVVCWWDASKKDWNLYPDNLPDWEIVFYVGDPIINIGSPNENSKTYVGSYDKPVRYFKAEAQVTEKSSGSAVNYLPRLFFQAWVGQKRTTVIGAENDLTRNLYVLTLFTPRQDNEGDFDLKIGFWKSGVSTLNLRCVSYSAGGSNVDVVLVIDRSGSMADEGKIAAAKSSAKAFVELMGIGDMIGVVSFDDIVEVSYQLTRISSGAEKIAAENAIDKLYARDSTSIGAGLQRAGQQLSTSGRSGKPKAIVLLSDGMENTAPYVSSVLPGIKSQGTKAFTIGFGTDADQTLLSDIASQTGGDYYYSPSGSASQIELQKIYTTIAGIVTGKTTIMTRGSTINPGSTALTPVVIDPSASNVVFSSVVGGSEMGFSLIDPDGNRINENSTASNVSFISMGNYKAFTIENPQSGYWMIFVTGLAVSSNEPYSLSVLADTDIIFTAETDKGQYAGDEPIRIDAIASMENGTIVDGFVTAYVTDPYSTTIEMPLLDDGVHGDGSPNDGTFSNYFTNTTNPGSYTFKVVVSGRSNSGLFTREVQKSVYVSQSQAPNPVNPTQQSYSAMTRKRAIAHLTLTLESSEDVTGILRATDLKKDNSTSVIPSSNVHLGDYALRFEKNKNTNVTLSVFIPEYVETGEYLGYVLLSTHNTRKIPIQLLIENFQVLTSPSELVFNASAGDTIKKAFEIRTLGYGDLQNVKAFASGVITNCTSIALNMTSIPINGTVTAHLAFNIQENMQGMVLDGTILVTATDVSPISIPVKIHVSNVPAPLFIGWFWLVVAALGSATGIAGYKYVGVRRKLAYTRAVTTKPVVCSDCSAENRPDAKFCRKCGKSLQKR